MTHSSLENYFNSMFAIKQHHGWGIGEVEELPIWERDIYIDMLMAHLKEQEQKRLQNA
jgi:hypothetical protein